MHYHLLNQSLPEPDINDFDKLVQLEKYENLYKHFCIFEKWDSYMLIYLSQLINNNFENLFDSNDTIDEKKEVVYHIICFKIYDKYSYIVEPVGKIIDITLKPRGKVNVISKLYSILEDDDFKLNLDEILQKVFQYEDKIVDDIKDKSINTEIMY